MQAQKESKPLAFASRMKFFPVLGEEGKCRDGHFPLAVGMPPIAVFVSSPQATAEQRELRCR
jgi:hypothetical protein